MIFFQNKRYTRRQEKLANSIGNKKGLFLLHVKADAKAGHGLKLYVIQDFFSLSVVFKIIVVFKAFTDWKNVRTTS